MIIFYNILDFYFRAEFPSACTSAFSCWQFYSENQASEELPREGSRV